MYQSEAMPEGTVPLFFPISLFSFHFYCTCMFFFALGLFLPQSADWFGEIALSSIYEPWWEEETCWKSLRRTVRVLKMMLWLQRPAQCHGSRGKRRPMSICWLVRFACYSFLSGSGGPPQWRFLTVINRDSFHPSAQFSEGQLSMKDTDICYGTTYRPPLPECIQLNINGTILGRTLSLSFEKQLTACGEVFFVFLRVRWAAAERQAFLVALQISLIHFFFLLIFHPLQLLYSFHHNSITCLSNTSRSTCVESPAHN